MTLSQTQVAIVGAGPAGMAAALAAAAAGAHVVVLDENPREGGQIFRQSVPGTNTAHHLLHPPSHDLGAQLIERLQREPRVERRSGAMVFAATADCLEYEQAGTKHRLSCERMILCAGAYDRVVPFPGWTLPGVITAGAAQVLVRGYGVKPGMRAVVAGTGPLLLPTITSLLAAGVEIVAAAELQSRWRLARTLPGVLSNSAKRREAWFYLRALSKHRVRLQYQTTVARAVGQDRLTGVELAAVSSTGAIGMPRAVVPADVLCVGHGLVPAIELLALLGGQIHELPNRGGFCGVHDDDMQSTCRGVYIAGETAGIGGAEVAVAEGTLAGLAAAASLGLSADLVERLEAARRRARHERRVADRLLAAFPVPCALSAAVPADTVTCRCEDVTMGQAKAAMELFGADLRAIKMGTRAGMGACQGRICTPILHDVLRAHGHRVGPVQWQVPVKPVSVACLVESAHAADPGGK